MPRGSSSPRTHRRLVCRLLLFHIDQPPSSLQILLVQPVFRFRRQTPLGLLLSLPSHPHFVRLLVLGDPFPRGELREPGIRIVC